MTGERDTQTDRRLWWLAVVDELLGDARRLGDADRMELLGFAIGGFIAKVEAEVGRGPVRGLLRLLTDDAPAGQ